MQLDARIPQIEDVNSACSPSATLTYRPSLMENNSWILDEDSVSSRSITAVTPAVTPVDGIDKSAFATRNSPLDPKILTVP